MTGAAGDVGCSRQSAAAMARTVAAKVGGLLLAGLLLAGLLPVSPAQGGVRRLDDGTGLRLRFEARAEGADGCGDAETTLVGLPPGGEVRLTVTGAEPGAPPCPAPDPVAAHLGPPGWLRRQRVARLVFAAGYRRVDVAVAIDGAQGGLPAQESATERAFYDGILANPQQARRWRAPVPRFPAARRAAAATSYRIEVSQTGVYRLRPEDLPGFEGAATAGLTLYTTAGGPLDPATDSVATPRQPVTIAIEDGGDGRFDGQDALWFFGEATSTWVRGPRGWEWRNDPYDDTSVYWLALDDETGAAPPDPRDGTPDTAGPVVRSHTAHQHFEKEVAPLDVAPGNIASGTEWIWSTLQPGHRQSFAAEVRAPASDTLTLRLRLLSRQGADERVHVRWNDRTVGPADVAPGEERIWEWQVPGGAEAGVSELYLTHLSGSQVLLDWFEIGYRARLRLNRGSLVFDAVPGARRQYGIAGAMASARVFALDATGGLLPIAGAAYDPATGILSFADEAAADTRYVVLDPAHALTPTAVAASDADRLLSAYRASDYVIISHTDFLDAAGRLADHRARDARFGVPLVTSVVDVQAIYDAFSGGRLDPTAIRNFLAWTQRQEPAPRYAVLFGDGTYDYRNHTGDGVNWIPPYEDGESTYDEFYARLHGADNLPDLAIGRLPVRTPEGARTIVDKLLAYDLEPEDGPWRSRVLLVADDTYNADEPELVETDFTVDAEDLAANHLPAELDLAKLYLLDYPREGRFKPQARDAFVEAINRGAALLTWVGHGNSRVFAHEHIFVLPNDLAALHNGGRLPFVYAAASQMGVFDDPTRDSVPEALLRAPDAGAVGMVAATRIGFHGSNMELARRFHDRLFAARRGTVPVGQALWEAKLLTLANPVNVQRYSLFGDPAMHLTIPRRGVELSLPDTLYALQVVRVEGRILDVDGTPLGTATGQVRLRVFDAQSRRRVIEQGEALEFLQPGAALFRGSAPVQEGRFTVQVPIPKDITYRGVSGRASAYVSLADGAAFGAAGPLVLAGTAATASVDDEGPRIDIGFVGHAFVDGGTVAAGTPLVVTLRDASGINITGEVGHGIVLRLDGGRDQDVTELYEATQDFRHGSLTAALPALEPGSHEVVVEAWDTRNNWSRQEAAFSVGSAAQALREARYSPNPYAAGEGGFSLVLDEPATAEVAVYSLSGRLVARLRRDLDAGPQWVSWSPPRQLANGTYLFAVAVAGSTRRGVLVVAR